MRELTSLAGVVDACGDDPLLVWAAQGLRSGVRAWALGDAVAVAVACAALGRRDRLALRGPAPAVAALVRQALAEVGPTYRPLGDAPLIAALVGRVSELEVASTFGWMDTRSPAPGGAAGEPAHWLGPHQLGEVTRLLARAFPHSDARPGMPGVRRWAGVRDTDAGGRLAATAADAWTAPGVGYVAGVATDPRARRRGHGASACRLVIDTLVGEHGRAALMVDAWNSDAIRLYQRLGLRQRAVAAARVKAGPRRSPAR